MTTAIETQQLTKIYEKQTVIDSANFQAETGSVHAIIGPNGAGKTTFLRMLATLVQPDKGTIHFFDKTVQDAAQLREHVHYISPEVNLYPLFKVKDTLNYAKLLYRDWDQERCKVLVEAFGLPLSRVTRKLSLGMKMRLQIVLALSTRPKVLLLDEATNGLDPAMKDQVLDLVLQEAANRGVTVIMATHQLEDVERVADTITLLTNGTMHWTASLDELKEQVFEVSAVLNAEKHAELSKLPEVLRIDSMENHLRAVWMGSKADILRHLVDGGATSMDIRGVSLQRWFQSMLQKEGITNDKIVLP